MANAFMMPSGGGKAHGPITEAISCFGWDNKIYLNIPRGQYMKNAGAGYPQVYRPTSEVLGVIPLGTAISSYGAANIINALGAVAAGTVITVNWKAWNNQQGRTMGECAGGGEVSFTINGHTVSIGFETDHRINTEKYGSTTFTV